MAESYGIIGFVNDICFGEIIMEELYKNPHFSELKLILNDSFPEKLSL